jgi:hypothetical protein
MFGFDKKNSLLNTEAVTVVVVISHELLWLSKYIYTYNGIEHFSSLFKFDKTFVSFSYNKGRPLPSG